MRNLTGSIRLDGQDYEWFGKDEWTHPVFDIDTEIPSSGCKTWNIVWKWGGECRVEIDMVFKYGEPTGRYLLVTGVARFYEGASEDTNELEDMQHFSTYVRARTDAPVYLHLKNGGGDHAWLNMVFKNKPVDFPE